MNHLTRYKLLKQAQGPSVSRLNEIGQAFATNPYHSQYYAPGNTVSGWNSQENIKSRQEAANELAFEKAMADWSRAKGGPSSREMYDAYQHANLRRGGKPVDYWEPNPETIKGLDDLQTKGFYAGIAGPQAPVVNLGNAGISAGRMIHDPRRFMDHAENALLYGASATEVLKPYATGRLGAKLIHAGHSAHKPIVGYKGYGKYTGKGNVEGTTDGGNYPSYFNSGYHAGSWGGGQVEQPQYQAPQYYQGWHTSDLPEPTIDTSNLFKSRTPRQNSSFTNRSKTPSTPARRYSPPKGSIGGWAGGDPAIANVS
jgi:hypothetical protein